ncbi:3-oxoacyl-ACP synthase III family protein [Montanilutibacter psychrotolerans]|nr:3-oxoacyl-[acyl-carrier-protein] synthase III C-terminal domain-containing protein [Lysobacter psychrotolerans]
MSSEVQASQRTHPAPRDLDWRVRIAGLGRYLPRRRVTSAEVESMAGLPQGWALEHSGVAFRHWADDEERASWMGAHAARDACQRAGIEPRELDLIVNASGSVERSIPDGGPMLQRELGLGASGIPSLSVHATCLSFIAALELAGERIHHGRIDRALLASSEIASVGLDFDSPEICSLFGDGAAAAVLERTPEGEASAIHRVAWLTMGDDVELTTLRGGGSWRPPLGASTTAADARFSMQGPKVLRNAMRLVPQALRRIGLDDAGARREVRWIAAHQASRAGLDYVRRLGFDKARFVSTLENTGNCIAASIPLTIEHGVREGQIRRGEPGLLLGTGAGLSAAALLMTY